MPVMPAVTYSNCLLPLAAEGKANKNRKQGLGALFVRNHLVVNTTKLQPYTYSDRVTFYVTGLYTSEINHLNLKKIIMKNLFKNSAFALLFLGYFASSCEKAKLAPTKAVAATPSVIQFKSIYTANGDNNQTIVSGDTVKVGIGTFIRIEPQLPDSIKECKGKWTHTVEGTWADGDYWIASNVGAIANSGVVNFRPNKAGNFKIIFTYTCPGKPPYNATINIIVE